MNGSTGIGAPPPTLAYRNALFAEPKSSRRHEADGRLYSIVGQDSGFPVLDGSAFAANDHPLEVLSDRIRRRHTAWSEYNGGREHYMFPAWLFEGAGHQGATSLYVVLGELPPSFSAVDGFTLQPAASSLMRMPLRSLRPSQARREEMSAAARRVVENLRKAGGPVRIASDTLKGMMGSPLDAEREMLEVWHSFVGKCRDIVGPHAFAAGITLEGLALLWAGRERGRDRQWLLQQYPWVYAEALRSGKIGQVLDAIDRSRANAVGIATGMLCCAQNEECAVARQFAKHLPKYRESGALLRLLGRSGEPHVRHRRAFLLDANYRDRGQLRPHAAADWGRTRSQLEIAVTVTRYLQRAGFSHEAGYKAGLLVFRTLAWDGSAAADGYRPDGADIDALAAGFAAVSADCMAAFFTGCLPSKRGEGEDDLDALDGGLLALVDLLDGAQRPELSARQLMHLARRALLVSVHGFEPIMAEEAGMAWPRPPGWTPQTAPAGAKFLDSLSAVRRQGWEMKNCLTDAQEYIFDAAVGWSALFAIETRRGERATLRLRAVERQLGKEVSVECYRFDDDDLLGPGNRRVSADCWVVARRVEAVLNAACRVRLPPEQAERRTRILKALKGERSFNSDEDVAKERWRSLYAPLLPRRLAELCEIDVKLGWMLKRAAGA